LTFQDECKQALDLMVKEGKLTSFIKNGTRYWINAELFHQCSICHRPEVCKEEKCDFMNLLGCHSSCLAKQRLYP